MEVSFLCCEQDSVQRYNASTQKNPDDRSHNNVQSLRFSARLPIRINAQTSRLAP